MARAKTMLRVILLISIAFFLKGCTATPICESACTCTENDEAMQEVDCSRFHFKTVPLVDTWPENAFVLDLGFNNITSIDVQFVHVQLTTLRLNDNKIAVVKPSVFGGLSNLKHLDLSHNAIESLEMQTFYKLEGLLSLNISHNKLKQIPENLFYDIFDMLDLHLGSNPIIHLEKAHFNRILNLQTLDISDIGAYSFPADLFSFSKDLRRLDISQNDFHEVPTEALRSAKSLSWLKLNENPIEVLSKTSFRRLSSLEELEISFMENLVSVGPQTFSELVNLRSLEMKLNKKLGFIDPDAFRGLFWGNSSVLQEINLEFNKLSTLSAIPCYEMEKVNLQRNPWICDCRLKWIKKCQFREIYAADLTCTYPKKNKDYLVVNIPEDAFVCDHHTVVRLDEILHHSRVMRTFYMSLGCVLLVVLFSVVILALKWKNIKFWWINRRRGTGAVYYVRARSYQSET